MAVTQNTYTGDGTTVLFSFTFPYLDTTHIKVSLNGVLTTAYTLANATTVQFNTAPVNGAVIRIYRETDDSQLAATFYPGSAIRSQDLNENYTQTLYVSQEVNNYTLKDVGNVTLLANYTFTGSTSLANTTFTGSASFAQSPTGPTPVNSNQFATKGYVDTFVKDTGSLTLTANYSFTNPVSVGTPTVGTHATTKAYVDGFAIGAGNVTSGSKGDIQVSLDLTTWTINANAITASKINDSAVTTSKINNAAVTPAKLDRTYSTPAFVYFASSF
jgi:hypothetical protein